LESIASVALSAREGSSRAPPPRRSRCITSIFCQRPLLLAFVAFAFVAVVTLKAFTSAAFFRQTATSPHHIRHRFCRLRRGDAGSDLLLGIVIVLSSLLSLSLW